MAMKTGKTNTPQNALDKKHFDYDDQLTLDVMLARACADYGDSVAYICEDVTMTYSQLDHKAKHLAAYLQHELGLVKGQRIAIMLPNIMQYPITMLAALYSGLVIVNLNPLDKAPNLHHELKTSGAKVVIVLAQFAHELSLSIPQTGVGHVIVTQIGDMFSGIKGSMVDFWLCYIKRCVPAYKIDNIVPWSTVMQTTGMLPMTPAKHIPKDLAFIQFTSGTTARPKGVMLTHGNLVANVFQAKHAIIGALEKPQPTVITALPLYHIFSLMANCLLFAHLGGRNILIPNARDIGSMLKVLSRYDFECFTGVNTLFQAMMKHRLFAHCRFKSLRLTVGGGMAVSVQEAQLWHQLTGCFICQAYGLSEASPAVSICRTDWQQFDGSVGMPFAMTSLEIRDPKNHQVVNQGQNGQIWVRGPQVMAGYWQDKASTDAAIIDGWLCTGDMGYIDTLGRLYLSARLKDIIIVSGFNVSPHEVESTILDYQGVSQAAVIGVNDDRQGQVIAAFIVIDDSSIKAKTIIDYCHQHLVAYKCPSRVIIVDDLPKNTVGKIRYTVLRLKLTKMMKDDQ